MPRTVSPKGATAATQPKKSSPAPRARRAAPAVDADVSVSSPAEPPDKQRKRRKEKVVRDSYSMPRSDFELITTLKQRMLAAGTAVKKSELLRAGLHMLVDLAPEDVHKQIARLEIVKTGRPAKDSPNKGGKKHHKKK